MRSDKSFFEFLRFGSERWRRSTLIILGVILVLLIVILLPEKSEPTEEQPDELTALCSEIEGVGECIVTVSYKEDSGEVFAVAVICEGAEDPEVRERLVTLFTSLYGVGANRVSVLKISEKN